MPKRNLIIPSRLKRQPPPSLIPRSKSEIDGMQTIHLKSRQKGDLAGLPSFLGSRITHWFCLLALTSLLPLPTLAQTDQSKKEAEAHFKTGKAFFQQKRWQKAATQFDLAWKL